MHLLNVLHAATSSRNMEVIRRLYGGYTEVIIPSPLTIITVSVDMCSGRDVWTLTTCLLSVWNNHMAHAK